MLAAELPIVTSSGEDLDRLILLGPRGSGKSTVGRHLAQRLGRPFVDLDDQIALQAGRSISEIFAAEGEAGFRDREWAALFEAVAKPKLVLATGGGVVVREDCRELLSATPSVRVFLNAEPEALHERIEADAHSAHNRPALTALPGVEEVRHLLHSRLLMYRAACTHEVDVTGLDPEEVVERVLGCVRVPEV